MEATHDKAFAAARFVRNDSQGGGPDTTYQQAANLLCELLIDRDGSGARLGLIDGYGFVNERALAQSCKKSVAEIRGALSVLIVKRLLSCVQGRGYETSLVTRDTLHRCNEVGYDPVIGICADLRRTAAAAIESIANVVSCKDRLSMLGNAKSQLGRAAGSARSDSVRDRGEAVFHATEAMSLMGQAAGLRWGEWNLRTGLNLLELSIRWNGDQAGVEVFDTKGVQKRVALCGALLDALTSPVADPANAEKAVRDYLGARVSELGKALSSNARNCRRPGENLDATGGPVLLRSENTLAL